MLKEFYRIMLIHKIKIREKWLTFNHVNIVCIGQKSSHSFKTRL